MKAILYMASTINGVIAREDDNVSFVSKVDFHEFPKHIQEIGNLVVGRRTYELMAAAGEFEKLGHLKVVVVTTNREFRTAKPDHLIARLPQEALLQLEHAGFSQALVAGGGGMNASFMEQNLLDEIYIDVEPWIIGKGVPLFSPGYYEAQLLLKEVKQLSENTVQLHYAVKK
jgi:dihydrofolate reductase